MSGTTVMAPAVDLSSISMSSFSRRSHSTPDLPSLPSRTKSPSLAETAGSHDKSLAEFATFDIPSFSTDLDLKLDISLPPLTLESQPPPSIPSENDDPSPPCPPIDSQQPRTASAASSNDGSRSWLRSLATIRDAPFEEEFPAAAAVAAAAPPPSEQKRPATANEFPIAVEDADGRAARDRSQSTAASFASFKRSWMPLSRAHAKAQAEAPAAANAKPEAKSSLDKLKRAATASITEIATNQTSQGRLVDAGAKPATKGFARATSYFSRIKHKPATTLSKTADSIGSDLSCASSATSLAQPGSSSIDTHVSQSASSAETHSTALTTDESASEMPARMPDPLWSNFKNLDLEIRGFASKPVAQQCALVKTLLLPFLKSATSQQPLAGLRPEDVDCRASVLNKWWSAVLDMLEVQHQQPVPGLDRQLLFETATTVMMRLEWRQTTPYFVPLADRSPQDRARARSSTDSSSASQSSDDQSAMLAESAEHNIRTMFVSSLVRQMAFVVDKLSLRHVPPSLIEFAGKTCAYAFFFAPGVADILVRLWGLTPDLIRRVSESMGLGRNCNEPVDEEIAASFPPKLSSLAWSSPRTLWTTLKRIPKMPLLVARVPWTGPWVMRWKGRDTDLLFIFCRYFHLLSDQFMPEGLSLTDKAQSPAFVLVHAQLLSILDSTIHRQAALESPQGSPLANAARGAEAAALQMPMPPNNLMKSMAENRLVVLLKDILGDHTLEYAGARHTFAEAFSALLKAATSRTPRYNSTACSTLCDLLEEVLLIYHRAETDEYPTCYIDWLFWIDVCKVALSSLNTLSEIRMISFIFTVWDAITKDPEQKLLVCRDWLLTEETFNSFFNNWCPMVRAYYMRLLCWRICRDKGSQNEIDMEIFALASKRLKSVWSHYIYLKQAAEAACQVGPATAPMSPTLGKRFIIIKHEVAVPQPGLFVTFDTFSKASSIISPANDTSSDPALVTKNDPKRKWSLLKLLSFGSSASSAQNAAEATPSKPSADEGLQTARREVANSRARQITPGIPPKTAGSDGSADSDDSNPVYEEPKFTFKFVLGWPQPQQQQQQQGLDRTLPCPRLPTPAQSRLGFKAKRGGGPTLPPLMIPTRKFSGGSQSGLVQAARNANASPLGSPVLEHRQPFESGAAIAEEEVPTSGLEVNSGASTPSESRLLPSPLVQPTPSEEWTGDAKVGPVKPSGAFVKNLVYSGRALSEWSLVVAECNNFVERRRDEGVSSLSDVEVPLLGVEGFRKTAG